MRRRVTARFVNGVISAFIVVFFLVHGVLGTAELAFGIPSSLAWLVWVGIALVGVHVVVSIVTSRQQLTDADRPPSPRKKRHLALKWATGILLASVVCVHVLVMRFGAGTLPIEVVLKVVTVVLSGALALHVCVGAKSVLKDLNIDRRYMTAFRVVVCVFAAAFVIAALFG